MSVEDLAQHIRKILLATPHAHVSTITAKDVRARLIEDVRVDESWIKENKKQINQLIATIFEEVSATLIPAAGADVKEEEGSADIHNDDHHDESTQSRAEDDDEAGSSRRAGKPRKHKTKREMTDEEFARQLSTELNGSMRSSRSGKAPSVRQTRKGASRGMKSAEHVDNSDASEDGSEANSKQSKKRRGRSSGGAKGGFGKEYKLSEPLSALLEVDRLSRPQVVKQLWDYIKDNQLQNPSNKKEILCDDRLRRVFNADKIDMFKMNKVLGHHLHEDE